MNESPTQLLQVFDEVIEGIERITDEVAAGLARLTSTLVTSIEAITQGSLNFLDAITTAFSITPDDGDFDLGTYDLTNVDRIFFNSNDGIDLTNTSPHIGSNSGVTTNIMGFYVPSNKFFQWSIRNHNPVTIMTLSAAGLGVNDDIGATGSITASNKIRVGTDSLANNGDIALSGSDVFVQSGGNPINLSNLTGGDSDSDSSNVSNRLPILFFDSTSELPGTDDLNEAFGLENGCVGIVRRGVSSTLQSNVIQHVFIYVKNKTRWYRLLAHNLFINQTLYGSDDTIDQKRLRIYDDDDSETINVDDLPDDFTIRGTLFHYQESNDSDDGGLYVVDERLSSRDYAGISNTQFTASTTNISELQPLPVLIGNSNYGADDLDETFSRFEGCAGIADGYLYVKVDGYWIEWEFGTIS